MQSTDLRPVVPLAAGDKIAATSGREHIKTQTKRQNLFDMWKLCVGSIDSCICTIAVPCVSNTVRLRSPVMCRSCAGHLPVIFQR